MIHPFDAFTRAVADGHAGMKPAPASLTFEGTANPRDIAAALSMQGLAVVHNFVSTAEVLKLRANLESALEAARAHLDAEKTAEYAEYLVNVRLERLKTFPDLAAFAKPVFNLR
ncbi:MAG: hypothetical protein JNK21_10805, partial [Rhodospirillaceae bacterium]|nr:hypothetical protein [Rhodospirillaceae bacterium]